MSTPTRPTTVRELPEGLPITTSRDVAALEAHEERWLLQMLDEAARLMGRRRRPDADDVVQEIALHTTPKVPRLMAQHPDPVVYARRRVQHAGISWDRTQRAQRGEGVRLHATQDGLLRPRREVVSGDAVGHDGAPGTFARLLDPDASFEAAVCDRMDAMTLLAACAAGIDPGDLHDVMLVDAYEHEVREVALRRGQARETVSRRVSRARRRLRDQGAAVLVGTAGTSTTSGPPAA